MPALDFDGTGNLIVTFYDRRDDPNNLLYHEYMAHIDSNGNLLEPNTRVSTFQSNPLNYPHSFIGDYQDIWDQSFSTGEFYLSGWVGIRASVIFTSQVFNHESKKGRRSILSPLFCRIARERRNMAPP